MGQKPVEFRQKEMVRRSEFHFRSPVRARSLADKWVRRRGLPRPAHFRFLHGPRWFCCRAGPARAATILGLFNLPLLHERTDSRSARDLSTQLPHFVWMGVLSDTTKFSQLLRFIPLPFFNRLDLASDAIYTEKKKTGSRADPCGTPFGFKSNSVPYVSSDNLSDDAQNKLCERFKLIEKSRDCALFLVVKGPVNHTPNKESWLAYYRFARDNDCASFNRNNTIEKTLPRFTAFLICFMSMTNSLAFSVEPRTSHYDDKSTR
ncbi:hypothetical protein J6590_010871 [Homalodisca vitripennis]|nr:hypothetical protein J6590_010871 [Homalodisca vitripennis]